MARAEDKDTAQREKSIDMCAEEIEETYQKAEVKILIYRTEAEGRSHLIYFRKVQYGVHRTMKSTFF